MSHLRPVSRRRIPVPGQVSVIESVILFIMGAYFNDWDNYGPVSSNLRKYFEKTPG